MTDTPRALFGWPPPALDPAGPVAGAIAAMSWVLFAMGALVLLLVTVLLGLALFGSDRWKARLGRERLVLWFGLALPVAVLSGLLIYGLQTSARLAAAPTGDELRIRVSGEMWWWRIAYLDAQGREIAQDANEIHIPAGRPVVFELGSPDVIHSLWIPRLAGKTDMIPGRRNLLRLQADQPGVYAGQCAEYCGGPHALMGLVVVAQEPAAFDAFLQRLTAPRPPPSGPGAAVFARAGCGACHTIRGGPANGLAGPDLTRVGARRTLGAGILPNNAGTLAGWIADSQGIKPGNRMPAYPVLSGHELRALAGYLEGLK